MARLWSSSAVGALFAAPFSLKAHNGFYDSFSVGVEGIIGTSYGKGFGRRLTRGGCIAEVVETASYCRCNGLKGIKLRVFVRAGSDLIKSTKSDAGALGQLSVGKPQLFLSTVYYFVVHFLFPLTFYVLDYSTSASGSQYVNFILLQFFS